MLEFCHRIAVRLYHLRVVLWLLAAAAAAGFVASVLGALNRPDLPLTSFVVCLWAVFLLAFASSFRTPPPNVDPRAPRLRRLGTYTARLFLWLVAGGSVLLFGFVAFLSLRTLGLLTG